VSLSSRLHTKVGLTDRKLASNNITMENQAKKRKDGAERLRDKNTSHSLDKVLPIEKRLFILHKAPKTIFRSNRPKKIIARSARSH